MSFMSTEVGRMVVPKTEAIWSRCAISCMPTELGRMVILTTKAIWSRCAMSFMPTEVVAMGTYEAEQARLERLMDETFDEEGLDDTDEEFINEELDVFETREEDSKSEQDLSDREDLTEEDPHKPYYLGKP
ncbi:hypothetical protein JTB14_007845 [Gonioctena quinquepunctata]|nr:hypothetical protein JTB14_007845 [Gonioctena quinquepunctata]